MRVCNYSKPKSKKNRPIEWKIFQRCFKSKTPDVFFMSNIKFSTHIHPLNVSQKNIETKHEICSKLISRKLKQIKLTSF